MRYIDDVFAVWTHGAESLSEYLDFLNTKHDTIKFTMERSDENGSLHFLDVLITVKDSGAYTTQLYMKPNDAKIVLHFQSAHPFTTKRYMYIASKEAAFHGDLFRSSQHRCNMTGAVSGACAPDGVHFATGTDQSCA